MIKLTVIQISFSHVVINNHSEALALLAGVVGEEREEHTK